MNNLGLLALKPAASHPHSCSFGISKHSMCCFTNFRKVAFEKIHRAVIERDEVASHALTLLGLWLVNAR